MDAVIRGAAVYLFLLLIFRLTGNRTLAQISTFDFVVLLIISEATQQALLGQDYSVTMAMMVITTFVFLNLFLNVLKKYSKLADKLLEGMPLVLVENGKPIKERLQKTQVDEDDILSAARQTQGLETMEQIKYAVLERSGGISIIPKESK